jgi:hypothetical protein
MGLKFAQPAGEVVKEFTRFGHVVQAAGSPNTALMLGHKLTGSRDLDVKRAQLEHTHGDLPIIARAGLTERGDWNKSIYQSGRA